MTSHDLDRIRLDVLKSAHSKGAPIGEVILAAKAIDMFVERLRKEMADTYTVFYQP